MIEIQFQTEEEAFWAGEFGNDYIERNQPEAYLQSNIAFFQEILHKLPDVKTVIELGANIGNNMMALHHVNPDLKLTAVEINQKAYTRLQKLDYVEAIHQSILNFDTSRTWDLVLLRGVLIHLSPEKLPEVNALIHRLSAQYICLNEYYSPTPMEIPYRGHRNRLYKRDFAGDMLDQFADLKLFDYGFQYRHDPAVPDEDMHWFVLSKS